MDVENRRFNKKFQQKKICEKGNYRLHNTLFPQQYKKKYGDLYCHTIHYMTVDFAYRGI